MQQVAAPDKPVAPDGAAARLRADIDRGATGEKINFPDHAAAPLGTDDEAGGTQTPSEIIDGERKRQLRTSAQAAAPAGYAATPEARSGAPVWWALGLCIAALALGIALPVLSL